MGHARADYDRIGTSLIGDEETSWGSDHPGEVMKTEKAMTFRIVLMK